jgi:outer membrane protein OmpA-like peptidoglycan-associated protein
MTHGPALLALLIAIVGAHFSAPGDEPAQPKPQPPANRRNFVACPIIRDTATQPCWLAEHEGELYYLGSQGSSASAFYPPQLGHEALIEGTVVDGPRVCGGILLAPVSVSVIAELNPACNTVLPAEAALTPARSPIAPTPKFPDTARAFVVQYDFDSDYITLHTSRVILEAARVAKAVNPPRIEVRGQRGATLLSNGRLLTEKTQMGEVRARKMGENLAGLGVPADRIYLTWQDEPDVPNGVTDPQQRRVTISLVSSQSAPAPCDRACLVGMADRYLAALSAGTPTSLPLAATVKSTENGVRVATGDGLWKAKPTVVTRRDVFVDAHNGQVAVWAVLDEAGAPVLLSARLKVEAHRVTEIETVVARKGSHALFSPDPFKTRTPIFDQVLEPAQRSSRERLIAIANGYFDGIEKHDSKLVSSANVCDRFENGVQMTNRGGVISPRACATAVDRLTHIKGVPDRRYDVVDEERGVVMSMVLFDIPADAGATPPRDARMLLLAEVFKIAGGEIQRIETVMHNLAYGHGSGWAADAK